MMIIPTLINIFSVFIFHKGDIPTQRHEDPFVMNIFIHSWSTEWCQQPMLYGAV